MKGNRWWGEYKDGYCWLPFENASYLAVAYVSLTYNKYALSEVKTPDLQTCSMYLRKYWCHARHCVASYKVILYKCCNCYKVFHDKFSIMWTNNNWPCSSDNHCSALPEAPRPFFQMCPRWFLFILYICISMLLWAPLSIQLPREEYLLRTKVDHVDSTQGSRGMAKSPTQENLKHLVTCLFLSRGWKISL